MPKISGLDKGNKGLSTCSHKEVMEQGGPSVYGKGEEEELNKEFLKAKLHARFLKNSYAPREDYAHPSAFGKKSPEYFKKRDGKFFFVTDSKEYETKPYEGKKGGYLVSLPEHGKLKEFYVSEEAIVFRETPDKWEESQPSSPLSSKSLSPETEKTVLESNLGSQRSTVSKLIDQQSSLQTSITETDPNSSNDEIDFEDLPDLPEDPEDPKEVVIKVATSSTTSPKRKPEKNLEEGEQVVIKITTNPQKEESQLVAPNQAPLEEDEDDYEPFPKQEEVNIETNISKLIDQLKGFTQEDVEIEDKKWNAEAPQRKKKLEEKLREIDLEEKRHQNQEEGQKPTKVEKRSLGAHIGKFFAGLFAGFSFRISFSWFFTLFTSKRPETLYSEEGKPDPNINSNINNKWEI